MRTLFALLILAPCLLTAAPDAERFSRPIAVPSAGWYRVIVDSHLWRYAQGSVMAFDENGRMLPCGILPADVPSPTAEEAQPRLVKIEDEGNDLALYLEIDRLAGKHDRLILDFGGQDYLEQATLWGSMDGKDWKPMARGTLFRLGKDDRMQGAVLDYPANDFDRLKLVLPRRGPEMRQSIRDLRVGGIRLHYAAEEEASVWIEETVQVHSADPILTAALAGVGEVLLLLDLPQGELPASLLTFPLDAPHLPLPITIFQMKFGVPEWSYACTLSTDADSLPVPGGRLHTPVLLKVGLQGAPSHVVVRRPREELVLFAERPGTVFIVYGGAEKRPAAHPTIHRPVDVGQAELGPVAEHPLALSPPLIRLVEKTPAGAVDLICQVNLTLPEEIKIGQWVAVEITPELVSHTIDAEEGNWGIRAEDHTIPSFWWHAPDPVRVYAGQVKLKADSAFPLQTTGEIVWGDRSMLPNWLSFKAHDHGEPIVVTLEVPIRDESLAKLPGDRSARPWQFAGRETISCGPWNTNCSAMMRCTNLPFNNALVTVEGKNLPPPQSLEITLWRTRRWLFFPVPRMGDVRLVFGSLENRWTEMLGQHIEPSRLSMPLPEAKPGESIEIDSKVFPWDRILFITGLILAAAALLYLIVKLLPRRQEG